MTNNHHTPAHAAVTGVTAHAAVAGVIPPEPRSAQGGTHMEASHIVDNGGALTAIDTEPTRGRVVLVGGGPGPLDLMTVRAVRALEAADVILYDRLGPTEDLQQIAPTAELISVGKAPGHHKVTQDGINQLLIKHALAGKNVARLKGGDPFVLGRGGEEMLACLEAGIQCEVIPGISSSISVPSAQSIPVTHRGVATAFTVISGHEPLTEPALRNLAQLGGTIVLLMGMNTLIQTTSGLLAAGMPAAVPAAVMSNGFRLESQTLFSTLGNLAQDAAAEQLGSPAVVVIGDVVTVGQHAAQLRQQAALVVR